MLEAIIFADEDGVETVVWCRNESARGNYLSPASIAATEKRKSEIVRRWSGRVLPAGDQGETGERGGIANA